MTIGPRLGTIRSVKLKTTLPTPNNRINHQIRVPEVRLVDEEGKNLGIFSLSNALGEAEDRGVDLIEVSPNAVPPICKLQEFGKFQYLQNKKEKQTKKAAATETKSLQIRLGTGKRDLELKAAKVSEFLKEGHRVKIELFLPGRSKYLDKKFLSERLERMLLFVSENYKISEPIKTVPKGLAVVVERDAHKGAKKEGEATEVEKGGQTEQNM